MGDPRSLLWAGCTKRKNHRALPQFAKFEIPHEFPRFPQIMGEWLVRRVRMKETGEITDHPCSKNFDGFLICLRRYPDTYHKKCKIEAARYMMCLEQHKDWTIPEEYSYMRFLERFGLFTEGNPGRFRIQKPSIAHEGVGTTMSFGDLPGNPRRPSGN
eukprot:gnl/MRDRNA2_/MRDRNA2_104966_c0_seq1.p1 gnl/MRDRNA2_/MRDRNA2_104966_c0~~gnl/MRDRNA2_/MRDRNA2_104966_c0_seq1.p1  ORF type:complete len:158 (+),score=22.80 gnl/MRDRNA2_/MRDRNA2_104966_c0_seq1:94-567(+)